MANVKITDLTAYTDAASTDVLPVVDVSNNVTKKISIADLLKAAPLGSAAAPGIAFDGDPNTGVYSPGADQVAISTNGAQRVAVDASGNVAFDTNTLYVDAVNNRVSIGTTSPGFQLDCRGTGKFGDATKGAFLGVDSNIPYVQGYDSTGTYNQLKFITGATEAARIDSSGRLLVGTSTSRTTAFGQPVHQIEGGSSNGFSSITVAENTQFGGAFILAKTRGPAFQAVTSGDSLGILSFQGANGSALLEGARIQADIDGTVSGGGASDLPTRLVFSVTADGASSPTERMRISQDGSTNIFSSGNAFISRVSAGAVTSTALYYGFHSATGVANGTNSFVVWANGDVRNTNNSYGAISDLKLKENIVDASSQWNDIKAIQVRNYNLKEGQTHRQIGLIAQEVELVSPGLVSESPDRDAEGNDLGTVTKSVNYSVLYMKAVKALQEAMERIETLEAKVAALESV